MASARPGLPQVYPHPRNDLTIPDLSTDPSGSAWKALYSVPGEPSGAPAVGAVSGGSSPAATPSPAPTSP
jgi:hypothetical protein